MTQHEEEIQGYLSESVQVLEAVRDQCVPTISEVVDCVVGAIRNGGTIYFCGNGGSAAGAQHIAAELMGRFERDRDALPAVSLTTDTSVLTAVSNDEDFSRVFSRQVDGLLREVDVLVGLSTSGTSENVVRALRQANQIGATTVGFTGQEGGTLPDVCDICLQVPSDRTAHIQEGHIAAGHIICGRVETALS